MMMIKKIGLLLLLASSYAAHAQKMNISSADEKIKLTVTASPTGKLQYAGNYKNKPVILPSSLSLKLKELNIELKRFSIIRVDSLVHNETWNTVWGEYASIKDHHKQFVLFLKDKGKNGTLLNVVFRVFNEGVGFRYEFPEQDNLKHFVLRDERSAFRLAGNHKTFGSPGITLQMNSRTTRQNLAG